METKRQEMHKSLVAILNYRCVVLGLTDNTFFFCYVWRTEIRTFRQFALWVWRMKKQKEAPTTPDSVGVTEYRLCPLYISRIFRSLYRSVDRGISSMNTTEEQLNEIRVSINKDVEETWKCIPRPRHLIFAH